MSFFLGSSGDSGDTPYPHGTKFHSLHMHMCGERRKWGVETAEKTRYPHYPH